MTHPTARRLSAPAALEKRNPVYRVAITGGPCAGKTTALAEVSERLRSRGFGVYVVPEAATLMFTGGATFEGLTPAQVLNFQTQLLRTQISLEDAFIALAAASNTPSFVLCDRGSCDGRAYMTPSMWNRMLLENGWDMVSIRDARYDVVVHLVTAADGAEPFYTLENNKTRSEAPEHAIRLDRRTQSAWVGHPHLRIVDNRTNFREKINRVDARISEIAGLHLTKRIVRKFLLSDIEDELPFRAEEFWVEQTFLSRDLGHDVQESVRKRGTGSRNTFVHKVRTGVSETKRQITNREYLSLLAHCDLSRRTVRIRRKCFLYNGNYFVLDFVTNVDPAIGLLRCHCHEGEDDVELPDWLHVEREVTGEQEYTMYSLSERVAKIRIREQAIQREDRISDMDFARSF
ncbi:P-loop containing nucleoside triphosphate hydrolase [Gracilaria domingensis]|nr:P-loop containing nucleoside triphosphate hydrolase [Gracilaria domingensis]